MQYTNEKTAGMKVTALKAAKKALFISAPTESVSVAMDIYSAHKEKQKDISHLKNEDTLQEQITKKRAEDKFRKTAAVRSISGVGHVGGAVAGAAIGSALGSVIPVMGTGIGFLLGGIIGESVGNVVGNYNNDED